MKKCDPNARAKCPDGKGCELYAEYADGSWCDTFNELTMKQPMTNADRIRAMSDEELAKFLDNVSIRCPRPTVTEDCSMPGGCERCVMAWLQQPAEEATP